MKDKRSNRVYIAGPMTGLPNYNYDAVHKAAAEWRASGWEVLNPAESFRGRQDLPYRRYMRNALKLVMKAGAIALLPGWENSTGALMEILVATRQEYDFFDAITGDAIEGPKVKVIVAA